MENTEKEAEIVEISAQTDKKETKSLIIEKSDLEQINKSRMQEQQILSAIGMLEVKKVEMISQIGQLKRNLEDAVKNSLTKIGIQEKDFPNYAINPNTGEVVPKQ